MIVGKPETIKNESDIELRYSLSGKDLPNYLWYKIDPTYANFLTDKSDAALVALLMPAMIRGEDLHFLGKISEELLYNASGRLQSVLQTMMPTLNKVKVTAIEVCETEERAKGVATGFSAGIDSFSAFIDHYNVDKPGFKLTHLIFNQVGASGSSDASYLRKKKMADQFKIPLIKIKTNLYEIYEPSRKEYLIKFKASHTYRNTSVAHLLHNGIGRFYYASTYSYAHIYVGEALDCSYCDPISLPLLSSSSLSTISVGSEYSRVEKTIQVSNFNESYGNLEVCVVYGKKSDKINCGRCHKCLRTLLTLEIDGNIHRYKNYFDMSNYYKSRSKYIAEVLVAKRPFEREIKFLMNEHNFKPPFISYVQVFVLNPIHAYLINPIFKIIRKFKNILE